MRARFAAVACSLIAAPLAAQQYLPVEPLIAEMERQRDAIVRYVAAMPDSALGFRPTPGVRTFAEQIEHIIVSNLNVGSMVMSLPRPAPLGDTTRYRHDKAALTSFVTEGFDRFVAMIRGLSPDDLQREFEIRQINARKPVWRWLMWFHEHGAWTLGQTVPYLRLNGVKPPDFFPF